MTSRNLTRAIALGALATIALSLASPAAAKMQDPEYVCDPPDGRRDTDDGYGRRVSCVYQA